MSSQDDFGEPRHLVDVINRRVEDELVCPEALERQKGRVPSFYAGLVEAGVRTGRINEVLATLTMYARSIANLRSIVVDAIF